MPQSSRDITNLSKKVIFLLHRIVTDASESEHDDQARTLRAASRAREKLKEIQGLFAAFREEIKEDRFWRYQKNVSPGLQEYIEALSFTHYIETGTLITYGEVQASISDDAGNPVRHSRCPLLLLLLISVVSPSPTGRLSAGSVGPYW